MRGGAVRYLKELEISLSGLDLSGEELKTTLFMTSRPTESSETQLERKSRVLRDPHHVGASSEFDTLLATLPDKTR